ncbi:MAG: sugar ABC transporter ATP-binding protein [Anaerolineae bacterium]|nr:sugar ABC transporter ATP-binding protein [Anaerolineae bacterium]
MDAIGTPAAPASDMAGAQSVTPTDVLLVEMRGISKSFPGVRALDNVDFELRAGEVHCLLGENGAGKSTLIKILTGVYSPDAGEIRIQGQRIPHLTPHLAQQRGISAIYQDFDLVPSLSIAENVFLGREPLTAYGSVNRDEMRAQTRVLFEGLDIKVNPDALLSSVGVGLQQLTEIVKALSRNSKIVIMDEPTTSLNQVEVQRLFAAVRALKEQNIAVVYISHRMQEVFGIGDRATVLRDGRIVGTEELEELTTEDLVAMMVGRKLQERYYKEVVTPGDTVLELSDITTADYVVRGVSFRLRRGEILGVAGLRRSGFKEVLRVMAGVVPPKTGTVKINDKPVSLLTPRDAIEAGIGYLPEDRKTEGLVLSLAVKNNIVLPILPRLGRWGLTNAGREKETAGHYVRDLEIRTPSMYQETEFLSGGNQQKVIMAKWLASHSQVLLFDEPTQGIDVGAKIEMYKLIARFVREGGALVMVSSEIAELMSICDRILVMRDGKIAGEFEPGTTTEEQVLQVVASSTDTTHE